MGRVGGVVVSIKGRIVKVSADVAVYKHACTKSAKFAECEADISTNIIKCDYVAIGDTSKYVTIFYISSKATNVRALAH